MDIQIVVIMDLQQEYSDDAGESRGSAVSRAQDAIHTSSARRTSSTQANRRGDAPRLANALRKRVAHTAPKDPFGTRESAAHTIRLLLVLRDLKLIRMECWSELCMPLSAMSILMDQLNTRALIKMMPWIASRSSDSASIASSDDGSSLVYL